MSQMQPPNAPPPAGASPTCANCGAPDAGELVVCRFCKQAVSAEAARTAIPCPNPRCRTSVRWGKQRCPACQSWIVVSCVFCGAISPHHLPCCLRCNEAFAGAAQRKAERAAQQQYGQDMQRASAWGSVAAAFVGAAAGSALSSSWSQSYDYDSSDHDGCPPSSIETFDDDDASYDYDD